RRGWRISAARMLPSHRALRIGERRILPGRGAHRISQRRGWHGWGHPISQREEGAICPPSTAAARMAAAGRFIWAAVAVRMPAALPSISAEEAPHMAEEAVARDIIEAPRCWCGRQLLRASRKQNARDAFTISK